MENRDILPRKKMESITYGAQCLVKQTMPCAECPIHAEGHEYPRCLHELGQMILDADAGEVGGMIGLIIREKGYQIESMKKIIEDQQERIDIMAADMPEWIRVSEKKPPYDKDVLLYLKSGECFVGHRENQWGQDVYCDDDLGGGYVYPTHWMPIPKPPKGDDQQ